MSADAIVVLGGRLTPEGGCGPALMRRVRRGVELYEAGMAPRLVMSGGGNGRCPEAVVMRQIAIAAGVPDAAILTEDRSNTTFENALKTAILLRERGLERVVLVTCAYHLPRARFLFRAAGLRVVGGQAAKGDMPMRLPLHMLREAAAWLRNLPGAARLRWGS